MNLKVTTSQEHDQRTQESHKDVRELRQLAPAQLGRQPFQLIVADLEHGLGLTHDLIN